ncbi:MAG: DNA-3-methyladenine glycosylase I [Pseudomonadota bacterium]
MRSFDQIFAMAAGHHGGAKAVAAALPRPLGHDALLAVPDAQWLSILSRTVFSAGFAWKVVEAKWPAFEDAFGGFVPGPITLMDDEALEIAARAGGIPHMAKARAVRDNAILFRELASEHGSAAAFFAGWPPERYDALLELLKKRGGRLGGSTAQYFLRMMGIDGWITTTDVTAALVREGVVDKAPTSRKAMAAVQGAFNAWRVESGRPLCAVSKTLALSVGPGH